MNKEQFTTLPSRYKSFMPVGDADVLTSGRSPQHDFTIVSRGAKGQDSKEVINSKVTRADFDTQQKELRGVICL